MTAPSVHLTTLGCSKNQVDSEKLRGVLESAGYVEHEDPATADVVMVLVSGEAKASMIAEIHSGSAYPAARVTARERVVWLLDEPAASLLT